MKIWLANSSEQKIGGGWSFIANFRKAMGHLIADSYQEADVYFIPSPTMVQRDEVEKAKRDGKKIVLRVDNAVRNSRNRNTGMTRMYDFAQMADMVVYQSNWARDYLFPFLKKDGVTILNGVDLELFHGEKHYEDNSIYLYTRYNRDETKNFEVARYWYSQRQLEEPDAQLWIVGNFSQELVDGNFDFYNGEKIKFWGVQPPEVMADIYRQAGSLIYCYYNDACSNTLIEALASGCAITGPKYFWQTGGANEIMVAYLKNGSGYFSKERMADDYCMALETL